MNLCLDDPWSARLPRRRHTAALGADRSLVDTASDARDRPAAEPSPWETDPFQDFPIAVVLLAIAVAVLGPIVAAFLLAV